MSEIIAILSGRGGTGKSAAAVSMAYGLSRKGRRVLLVDLCLGMRCLDQMMGLAEQVVYDISDISDGRIKSKKVILSTGKGPDLLPASQTRRAESLDAERLGKLFTQLRANYDVMLLDVPAGRSVAADIALASCDRVILVETPDGAGIRGLDVIRGYVSEQRSDLSPQMILNRYMPGAIAGGWQTAYMEICEVTGLSMLGWIPFDPAFVKAIASGGVGEGAGSPAFDHMEQIISAILGEKTRMSDPADLPVDGSRSFFGRLLHRS